MRGLVLCGLFTLLSTVSPLGHVPTSGPQPSAEASKPRKTLSPASKGALASQGPAVDVVSSPLGPTVECTGLVVVVKPPVDPGMAQPIEAGSDLGMAVRSPCRK
jgi:hypothetical protein